MAGDREFIAVIPARFASSRLPGKPLAEIDGEPMLAHVWRRAGEAGRLGWWWPPTISASSRPWRRWERRW